jgi:hypothetical protein
MWSDNPLHRVLDSLRATAFSQSDRFKQFRRHMAEITAATVVVIAIGTLLVFLFERHAPGTADLQYWRLPVLDDGAGLDRVIVDA